MFFVWAFHDGTAGPRNPASARRPMLNHGAGEGWLPLAPFRRFLLERRRREAARLGIKDDNTKHYDSYLTQVSSRGLLANMVGMNPRRVDDYLKGERLMTTLVQVEDENGHGAWVEEPLVSISTVDRVLAHNGTFSMHDVYSEEEIEQIDLASSGGRYRCSECGIEMLRPAEVCGFCIEERLGVAA